MSKLANKAAKWPSLERNSVRIAKDIYKIVAERSQRTGVTIQRLVERAIQRTYGGRNGQ